MKRVALAAALLAACAHPPPRRAVAPIHRVAGREQRHVSLSLTDALGGSVRLGAGQLRPAVVVFMSRESRKESAELLRRLDESVLNGPVDSVGVVDVERYAGAVRHIAERRLRQSFEDARVGRRQRRLAHGLDASPAFVDRWHLIGDFDGAVLEAFGVEPEPEHPVSFLVDRSGAVSGPYRDLDSLLGAIGAATGQPGAVRAASASSSGDASGAAIRARTAQ